MAHNIEKDDVSGTATTGHTWDGIKELNLRADEFITTGSGSGAAAFQRLGGGVGGRAMVGCRHRVKGAWGPCSMWHRSYLANTPTIVSMATKKFGYKTGEIEQALRVGSMTAN